MFALPHTQTHTWLHMFVIIFFLSSLPYLPFLLSYPYPYPSFLVAIPFGYSCSRPLPTCAVHECKSLSLFFLFFIFYFLPCVCVLFFCCSLLAARCAAVPNIPLYPFISVAQYLYPSVCPSVCVFVYLCVTCRQRM